MTMFVVADRFCINEFFPPTSHYIIIVADVTVTLFELNADAASRTFLAVLFEGKTKTKERRSDNDREQERAAASGNTDDDGRP